MFIKTQLIKRFKINGVELETLFTKRPLTTAAVNFSVNLTGPLIYGCFVNKVTGKICVANNVLSKFPNLPVQYCLYWLIFLATYITLYMYQTCESLL